MSIFKSNTKEEFSKHQVKLASSAPQHRAGRWGNSRSSLVPGFYAIGKNDIVQGIIFLNCMEGLEPLVLVEGLQ